MCRVRWRCFFRGARCPAATIYEVITFYNYFKLEKPGKYNIAVCMGTACYLKGASQILDAVKDLLNIDEGGDTPDGMFRLEQCGVWAAAALAP